MSGGVDSSVAAWLLREQGHDVVGLFMRHGQGDCPNFRVSENGTVPFGDAKGEGKCGKQGCCTAVNAADARRVADVLDIPFYAVNFEQEFARIVDYFVREYTAGRTPNPCIVCNTWLKFGRLFDYADSLGAEYVATGHYARLVALEGGAEKGTVPICAKHPSGRSGKWGLSPFSAPEKSHCAAAATNRRINPTCCSASQGGCSPGSCFPWAIIKRKRFAG